MAKRGDSLSIYQKCWIGRYNSWFGQGAKIVNQGLALVATIFLSNTNYQIRTNLTWAGMVTFALGSSASLLQHRSKPGFAGSKSWRVFTAPTFFVIYHLAWGILMSSHYLSDAKDYVDSTLTDEVRRNITQFEGVNTTKSCECIDKARLSLTEAVAGWVYLVGAFALSWLAEVSVAYWIDKTTSAESRQPRAAAEEKSVPMLRNSGSVRRRSWESESDESPRPKASSSNLFTKSPTSIQAGGLETKGSAETMTDDESEEEIKEKINLALSYINAEVDILDTGAEKGILKKENLHKLKEALREMEKSILPSKEGAGMELR